MDTVDTNNSVSEGATPKAVGGGTSAVAASSHAACPRFRGSDPLITGHTRRRLARELGFEDEFGGIPEARWMRAMTFERLVRDKRFASELATTAVGRLELDRPTKVVIANAREDIERTAELLAKAHERAVSDGAATMLHGLAIPFVGFEDLRATDVKPDFAVVAPRVRDDDGEIPRTWLIVGDAKDYERVRSQIDDARLLKGFLQVALGAESAANWSRLPPGMAVHRFGTLAVPRNAFLQPEALVEDLSDHRKEVRMRVAERRAETAASEFDATTTPLEEYVGHLEAVFDPASCASCTLFSYCRDELRKSTDPQDLLVELGVPRGERTRLVGLLDGSGAVVDAPASIAAMVQATVSGVARSTGQGRLDPAGLPGTINIVLAKSDSAALGVYGMATQLVTSEGSGEWRVHVFDDPQSLTTRRTIMKLLGADLVAALTDRRKADPDEPLPVHLVVPDKVTADVLTSIADNLAGIELSRLQWQRDKQMGRPPLTFDGEPASMPRALSETARTAISFLLEEDRARALSLRSPIVDVRATLAAHTVPGGPAVNALRLDYLATWAEATESSPVNHRSLSEVIEAEEHTPGARLSNRRSDEIHAAFVGTSRDGDRPADPSQYEESIRDELAYKIDVLERGLTALDTVHASNLRDVRRAIEGDAQAVWRRRLRLHASDLVRFGRTAWFWRNALVATVAADAKCSAQLTTLTNPEKARDLARNAGAREVATARVVELDPLTLEIDSRRIGHESRIVLIHVNDRPCVEAVDVAVKLNKTNFKISGLSIGPLEALDDPPSRFAWSPARLPELRLGDELVVADFKWFGEQLGNVELPVPRPAADQTMAPKSVCTPEAYGENPEEHGWCCRPHEVAEAERADNLAERRANGELNPEKWPPVVDEDAFEVTGSGAPVGDSDAEPPTPAPEEVTADDLD